MNVRLRQLEDAGLLGVVEVDGTATVYLPDKRDVGLPGRWEPVPARDWNAEWRAGIEPVSVGAVTVVPPWLQPPAGEGSVLVVEPGQAFGTGHHETTTGCLAALQDVGVAGRSVLDVGTGTGILAIAAAVLGAGVVVAVDTDPLAVAAAQENAAANGVAIDVRLGSVDSVQRSFDVVLANLDTATLTVLAAALSRRVAEAGTLVASGVGNQRAEEAADALRAAGLDVDVRPGREWTVLRGRRRAGAARR